LYLLDKFAVSDELYHEFTMLVPSLPRSYVIRRIRKQLSDSVVIKKLPHPFFGAYRPLMDSLKEAFQALIEADVTLPSPVEVKNRRGWCSLL
jgi:hypothetical protein